jgi:transposase
MSASVASRRNPVIRPFVDDLIARGKPYKVAMVACMRKLLLILNAMIKTNEPWDFSPSS